MKCPDCTNDMKKMGTFYTCKRCGLSFKPWEVEEARKRARDEINEIKKANTAEETKYEKKKRDRLSYRNWYEGKTGYDD